MPKQMNEAKEKKMLVNISACWIIGAINQLTVDTVYLSVLIFQMH